MAVSLEQRIPEILRTPAFSGQLSAISYRLRETFSDEQPVVDVRRRTEGPGDDDASGLGEA
jgi:hypothetical protein